MAVMYHLQKKKKDPEGCTLGVFCYLISGSAGIQFSLDLMRFSLGTLS